MNQKPKFQHDCSNCEYLGTFFDLDVYLCRSRSANVLGGSLIARHGDDGPDYASTPICVLLDQFENPEHRIGLGVGGPSMPMQDYLFSEHVHKTPYYKAWLLALALMPVKQLLGERDQRERDDATEDDQSDD